MTTADRQLATDNPEPITESPEPSTDNRQPTTRNPQTGPKTAEGKKRSSLNGLTHGLTARSRHAIQAITESIGVDFDTLLADLRAHYKPADPVEDQLVNRIARSAYRLALAESMERSLLENNPFLTRPNTSYDQILRYERLVDIHLHRAIAALARKREVERRVNPESELSLSTI